MTKAERIKAYNSLYDGYNITNIKKMTESEIESRSRWGVDSLDELYKSCSDAKRRSFNEILRTYKPSDVKLIGNSMTYSVFLTADNGSTLWITRNNNYLVERV